VKKLNRIGENLNAFRFSFDEPLLDEIRESYQGLVGYLDAEENQSLFVGGDSHNRSMVQPDSQYQLVSYGSYPLLWLSTNDAATFAVYQRFFDALDINEDIKQLVDHDETIVMYCGFLVVGDRAPEPLWHVDYESGANAYTLITPLFELDADHGNLLYERQDGETGYYEYQAGEAVVFGDNFMHSTEAYEMASQKRVLVSLTFGTDKMKYWNILRNTIGDQSDYMVLPCGHVQGTCGCEIA
jgi:hypothetical protein